MSEAAPVAATDSNPFNIKYLGIVVNVITPPPGASRHHKKPLVLVPPPQRFPKLLRKPLAALASAILLTGAFIALPSQAATSYFNPLATNAPDGLTATFGVLAQGNMSLGNGHNQSALAVLGDFSLPVQGNGNARMGSEAVPTIDGAATRLLAQKFTDGGGTFDVTNDFIKFGSTSNLDLVSSGPAKVGG